MNIKKEYKINKNELKEIINVLNCKSINITFNGCISGKIHIFKVKCKYNDSNILKIYDTFLKNVFIVDMNMVYATYVNENKNRITIKLDNNENVIIYY